MFKKNLLSFSLSTSVGPCPVSKQKTLSPRDLKNDNDLNIQNLWDDRPMYGNVFTLFIFFAWRNFRLTLEALQKLFSLSILVLLHKMIILL